MAEIIGRVGIRNYVSPIPQASTLINGLIHAWNANGNANDSIGGLNGTLVNGTLADAAPKIGSGAFYFDRINDYISLPNNSLNLDTDFTISFWCKDGFGGINRMIIHNAYFANDTHTSGWAILYGGNGIEFDIFNNNANVSLINTVGSFNRLIWNHVTVKYTRGVKMEIFLNGVLNATKNTTLTPLYSYTPIKTSIGSWNSLYSPTLYAGDGLLDAINIWNRALTSAEITELYGLTTELQAPTPTYPTSLKLFIDAGNALSYSGTGTTVTDLTGTQNGTLVNGTGWSSANGGTFTFDGINDYIDFGINTAIQSANSRTVSVWVNYTTQGFAFSDYNPNTGLNGILILKDSTSRGYLCTNTGNVKVGTTTISTNTWYYTTFSFDATSMAFYLNGALISTTPIANQGTVTTPYSVLNGVNRTTLGDSYPSSFPLNGKIAQLKIYENKLSDAQILTDFNEFKSRYGY